MYQSSIPCCWSRSNTTKSTYKIKMEKEIIERSKEVRRDMTDFNKLVKFLKKQAESKPSTVTITKVGNQLVLMGNGGVIDSLDKKTGEKIIKAFEAAEDDTTFVSNYQIRLPKLFADLRLLKKKKIWTAKMMQAQALTYFCILGFGVGGFRSFDDEEEPDFWPDFLTWNEYSHPSDETMAVNEAVIRAILRFYNLNPDEHFNDVEVPEDIKKKQNKRQTAKRNKRFKSDRDAKDIADDEYEDVTPPVNKTKVNTKRIFDDKQEGKKKAPEPLIESEEDDIKNYSDQEETEEDNLKSYSDQEEAEENYIKNYSDQKEAEENEMKDYSDLEDLDTEDVSTTVNKIKVNTQKKFYKQGETKKAPKPLIGDSESEEDKMEEEGAEEDEFEDYSDLDLDTESENELPNEAGSSKGIPRTKYDRYLAGEDFGWTAGDANPSSKPSSTPHSPSSSFNSQSSTKVLTKHLAPAKTTSRLRNDGTDKNNIIPGTRKRKPHPIDWNYEYSK